MAVSCLAFPSTGPCSLRLTRGYREALAKGRAHLRRGRQLALNAASPGSRRLDEPGSGCRDRLAPSRARGQAFRPLFCRRMPHKPCQYDKGRRPSCHDPKEKGLQRAHRGGSPGSARFLCSLAMIGYYSTCNRDLPHICSSARKKYWWTGRIRTGGLESSISPAEAATSPEMLARHPRSENVTPKK